jgi:hypothetical protein
MRTQGSQEFLLYIDILALGQYRKKLFAVAHAFRHRVLLILFLERKIQSHVNFEVLARLSRVELYEE